VAAETDGTSDKATAPPPDAPAPVSAGTVYATATRTKKYRPKPGSRSKRKSSRRFNDKRKPMSPGVKRVLMGIAAAMIAVIGAGFHTLVVPLMRSTGPDAKAALVMMDTLRKMPSKQSDLTVDACMHQQLETSRRVGNLKSYQGWHVEGIPGSKTTFVLVYSYEENDKSEHRTEWLVDISTNTFTPQNDAARAVYGN